MLKLRGEKIARKWHGLRDSEENKLILKFAQIAGLSPLFDLEFIGYLRTFRPLP
jgi:hypothetical protein